MPDRVIREGWLTSPNIRQLEAKEEIFFFRLLLVVDDWGRAPAHPDILRKLCFPVVSGIRSANIAAWLDRCESLGLLRRYPDPTLDKVGANASEQRIYLKIVRFRQRIRHVRSKFPSPPDETDTLDAPAMKIAGNKIVSLEKAISKESKTKHHGSERSSETNKTVVGAPKVDPLKERVIFDKEMKSR